MSSAVIRRTLVVSITFGMVVAGFVVLRMASRTVPPARNVLLITIDTLRADRLGCYGYRNAKTPNIDRLAAEGALFENAFCDVTWTTPSLSSAMTGLYAVQHGLKSTYQRLDPGQTTLAEMLKAEGFAVADTTHAVVGSFPASKMFGLGQGFDSYDEEFDTPIVAGVKAPVQGPPPLVFHEDIDKQRWLQNARAASDGYRPDDQVTDAALRWIDGRAKDQRFFLWAHYFGPHEKIDQSLNYFESVNRAIAAYDADIATSDREVGRLIDGLRSRGVLDDTIVILHADHGQSLNEHSYFGHGKFLYAEVLRIPFIVRHPGLVRGGRRVTTMARNVDIVPTVLGATGTMVQGAWAGRDLLKALAGGGDDPELYCETYLSATQAFATKVVVDGAPMQVGFRRMGVRTAEWMFIRNEPWPFIDVADPPPVQNSVRQQFTSEELYDLRTDRGELTNLVTEQREVADRMRARMWHYLTFETDPKGYHPLDAENRDRLRALGYVE